MSEPKSANTDPSMDDILASIRKIISADEARAQVGGAPASPARSPGPALHAVVSPAPVARIVEQGSPQPDLSPIGDAGGDPGGGRDDVLLLTDLIEEPRAEPAPQPLPLPRIDPVRAADMPQPALGPEPAAGPPTGPRLVAGDTASSAAEAFARLSQAVQESVLPPAAAETHVPLATGGKSVEELAADLLRPMLKDWLDRNLPTLVERLVEREIARLTRR